MSQEQGSYIFFKGSNTVCGPGVWMVLLDGGVETIHVLQVSSREVTQASAPGVIAVSLVRVCNCAGGGAGGAKLEEVFARGWDVIVGVVIFSVDVDVGVDQVIGLGIEGSREVVLALLGVGV